MKTTDGSRTVGDSRWGKAEGGEEERRANTGNAAGSRQGERSQGELAGGTRDMYHDGNAEATACQLHEKKILRCSK